MTNGGVMGESHQLEYQQQRAPRQSVWPWALMLLLGAMFGSFGFVLLFISGSIWLSSHDPEHTWGRENMLYEMMLSFFRIGAIFLLLSMVLVLGAWSIRRRGLGAARTS